MEMVVIGDDNHMTSMNDNVNGMKLAHIIKTILKLRAPFCTPTFIWKQLIAFLNVHTRGRQYLSHMYTVYANASKKYPFLHSR